MYSRTFPKKQVFLLLLCSCYLLLPTEILAQNTQPIISWTGVGIKKRLTKKATVSLNEQIRFNKNSTKFESLYTDFGFSFQTLPFLKLNPRYRFTHTPTFNWHRIYLDVIVHRFLKNTPLTIAFRFRSQYDKVVNTATNKKYLRQKVSFQYKKSKAKITPYTEFELFYRLPEADNNHFERYRIHLGAHYAFHKKHKINFQYIFQYGIQEKNRFLAHIFNLNYGFAL